MEQLTGTKVEQFQNADDARKIKILGNIDTGVSYDCTIKITEWNGRFEATVVRLTPVLVEQAAALETETEPVNRACEERKTRSTAAN